jgi:diguanylate cyclase (GGDEF)-like protein
MSKSPSNADPANELVTQIAQHGLGLFLQSSHMLAGLLSPDGRVVSFNPAFESFKNAKPDAITLREFVAPSVQEEFDNILLYTRRMNKATQTKLEFGEQVQHNQFDCMFIPLEHGGYLFFCEPVLTVGDESRIKQLETEIKRLSTTVEKDKIELQAVKVQADEVSHIDFLTYLPNRRFIVAELQRQIMYSDRYNTPLTISMLDLDHFKQVNDTHGHSSGDDVLKKVSSDLRDHIRQPDEIGRYGGEEFLVILQNSGLKAACEQATRLCQQVRSTPIISGGKVIHMTISIGIAQYSIHNENWQKLLDRSDQALLQAKQNGRDQWAVMES